MKRALLGYLLAMLLTACRGNQGADAAAAAQPDAALPKPAPGQHPSDNAKQEAAARSLVERWLDAQNRQDFAAYEALYGSRFTGIKRAGDRTTSFDRAGWLKDRKGMFARVFHVEASNVSVNVMGATSGVSLEQSFRSSNFADRGPKQLVLAMEQDGLRIVREEMLTSQLGEPTSLRRVSDKAFAFVRTIAGRRYWLSTHSPAGFTVQAEPQLVEVGAAFAPVQVEQLPPALRELASSVVVLDPHTSAPCQVKLERWGVLADFDPHFAEKSRWSGHEPDGSLTPQQIAREIFGEPQVEGRFHKFAVDITEASRACPEPLWARAKSEPHAPSYRVRELSEGQLAELRARMRQSELYQRLQRAYRSEGLAGRWDEAPEATTRGYACTVGKSQFNLSSIHHAGDCGSFGADLTLFSRSGPGRTVSLPSQESRLPEPSLALDLDLDGVPEWLFPLKLVGWDGQEYRAVVDAEPPSFDCPC